MSPRQRLICHGFNGVWEYRRHLQRLPRLRCLPPSHPGRSNTGTRRNMSRPPVAQFPKSPLTPSFTPTARVAKLPPDVLCLLRQDAIPARLAQSRLKQERRRLPSQSLDFDDPSLRHRHLLGSRRYDLHILQRTCCPHPCCLHPSRLFHRSPCLRQRSFRLDRSLFRGPRRPHWSCCFVHISVR